MLDLKWDCADNTQRTTCKVLTIQYRTLNKGHKSTLSSVDIQN